MSLHYNLTGSFTTIVCLGLSLAVPQVAAGQKDRLAGKPGYYTSGFHILPEIEVTGYYNDNIYATQRDKESDVISVVSASLEAESQWDRHSLDLGAGAAIGRYLDISAEDYEDFWFKGDGQLDLNDKARIYGGAGYSVNHEGRDSKEGSQQQIDEPTTYDVQSLQAGLDQQLGRSMVKFGITFEALDYDNVGTLVNDDRDRSSTGLGLRLNLPLTEQTSLFAQGILNQRDYEDELDQFGYDRDSDGYNALLGVTSKFRGGHSLEAYVGYLVQEYNDSRFARLNEPNYGFDLRWYPTIGTKVSGKLERSLNETTEIGSSGYLYTGLDLQLDRKMATDVVAYLNYNYGLAEFQDVGREDRNHSVTVGLKYFVSPKVMISGSYSHSNNDSNDNNSVSPIVETYDYASNLLFINLRARLVL
jgi:hypothetical protein